MGRATHAGAFRVRFVAILTAMYIVMVLAVTLWPTTVDQGMDPYINRLLAKLWSKGVPTFVDYNFIEFSANIVFFVPVGFLLGLLFPYRYWFLAIVGGGLLSAAVETAQGLFLPGRVSSIHDVIANTSGAMVGCLVAVAVRMLILHRDALVIRDVAEGRRASNGLPVRDAEPRSIVTDRSTSGGKVAVTTERPRLAGDPARTRGARRVRDEQPIGLPIRRTNPAWEKSYRRRLVVTDAVLLAVTLLGTQAIWVGIDTSQRIFSTSLPIAVPYSAATVALFVFWLLFLKLLGTRDARVIGSGFTEYSRIAGASFRLFGVVAIVALLLQFTPARGYIVTAFPAGVVLLIGSRWAWRQWLRAQRRSGRYLIRVLLVGAPSSVDLLHDEFARRAYLGFEIVGACLPEHTTEGLDLPVERLGSFEDVGSIARSERVHAVALAGSEELPPEAVRRIGWRLESTGVDLMVAPAITEVAGTRIHTRPVGGLPLMYVDSPSYEGGKKTAKTVLDFGLALFAIVLTSPLMLATAVGVKLTSPGPVLFRQQRIGLNGKAFDVYKFRSMRIGADAELAELLRQQGTDGQPLFKVDNDPRITRFGAFIRKYSLDELPQFFNVVKGQMSIVGPRPQRAEEVALYDNAAGRRLLVKPGITGLWQVSGRSDLSWEDTVRLDLYYAENWSLLDDFVILLWTVKTVLQSRGAR